MPRILTFLKAKWRQYCRRYKSLFAQTGPTRRLQGLQRPEHFLQVLTLAVDRELARQSMLERLNEAERQIKTGQRFLDELAERSKFFNERIADVPMLETVINEETGEMIEAAIALEQEIQKRDLLRQRMLQWQCKQEVTLKRLYGLVPVFLRAVDQSRKFKGIPVPTGLMGRLRLAAYGARLVEDSRQRVAKAKNDLSKVRNERPSSTSKPSKMSYPKLSQSLRESGIDFELQKSIQMEREIQLLRDYAWPFLTNAGLMFVPRRSSDASSTSRVASLGDRPNPHWSKRHGPLPAVDDVIEYPAESVQPWIYERGSVAIQRRGLEKSLHNYTADVAEHLHAFPNSTQAHYAAIVEENAGINAEESLQDMRTELLQRQDLYEDSRLIAIEADAQDLPLSPDWAASVEDVTASKASSALYRMTTKDIESRRKRVRRWNRQTTRRRPFGERGAYHQDQPLLESDRILPSPTFGRPSTGAVSSCLTPRARSRRIRRMNQVAANLRRQFEFLHGTQYISDTHPIVLV